MDLQYHGGNCLTLINKRARVVIDDNLAELGIKSILKDGDIALYSGSHAKPRPELRLLVDSPGEYEILDLSIVGIATRGHMDEPGTNRTTMYKILVDDTVYLFTGHIYPELNDEQLEKIGMVDVMCVPVGGNGYTLDATGALQLIKAVEPKIVIPTHYADPGVHYPVEPLDLDYILRELGMEVHETTMKFRYKSGEATSNTQLEILTRS